MSENWKENVASMLYIYITQQKAAVENIRRNMSPDDPRYDIYLRHEASKLYMLECLLIDSGCTDYQRTVTFNNWQE